MTRRFYVPPGQLSGPEVVLEGALAHRLVSVLRLGPDAVVTFFDGSGEDVTVRIETATPKRVAATVIERAPGPPESRTKVHLYQSIAKGERFEWLVEKVTEVGVFRIVPLITARAVVRTAAGGNKPERWERIAIEAAEQCGRSSVPVIDTPQSFAGAIADAPGVLVMPYEEAGEIAPSIQDALSPRIDELFASDAISIFIGPEGGFERAEVESAIRSGAAVVTLGDRVLRSETAGLVATVLVMQACGALG